MGKKSTQEIRGIGEGENSEFKHQLQKVIDTLNEGKLERVAELLRETETITPHSDQYNLIDGALQICLACIQIKAEMAAHLRSYQEDDQRQHDLQQKLSNILNLVNQSVSTQNLDSGQVEVLGSHLSQARLEEFQTPGGRTRPGFWQRVWGLLVSLFPPHTDEITTLIDDLRDASRHEIITTNDQDEVRRILPSKFEEESGQGPLSLVVYFLGIFRVYQNEREITEWHSLKGRDILKYLLSRPGTPVIKDVLMDIFWPDVDPKAARRNLHQAIYSLRQSLRGEQPGFHHIWFENDCYFLNPQMNIWLDFREFENYIQVGRRLDTSGQLEDALAQYGMAEGLYQGDFLEEDLYEDWPMVQREQLLNLYLSTADKMGDYYLQNRQYAAAVSVCQKVLAKDRCYEAAHRRLMQCYLAQGQRHLAIRQYQTCLRSLKEELDIKPSEEIVELYLRISSQSIF